MKPTHKIISDDQEKILSEYEAKIYRDAHKRGFIEAYESCGYGVQTAGKIYEQMYLGGAAREGMQYRTQPTHEVTVEGFSDRSGGPAFPTQITDEEGENPSLLGGLTIFDMVALATIHAAADDADISTNDLVSYGLRNAQRYVKERKRILDDGEEIE